MKLLKNKKIEDQYSYPDFQTSDGEPASLEILDTAGQEEYSVMHDQWIREGGAFIILFSLDEKSTFDNALAMRKKIERAKDAEDFPMVLVGNKADKPNREVSAVHRSVRPSVRPSVRLSVYPCIHLSSVSVCSVALSLSLSLSPLMSLTSFHKRLADATDDDD